MFTTVFYIPGTVLSILYVFFLFDFLSHTLRLLFLWIRKEKFREVKSLTCSISLAGLTEQEYRLKPQSHALHLCVAWLAHLFGVVAQTLASKCRASRDPGTSPARWTRFYPTLRNNGNILERT